MKRLRKAVAGNSAWGFLPIAGLVVETPVGLAPGESTLSFPVEMNMPAFLIIGGLLVLSILLLFMFQRRFYLTHRELQDLANELNHTRQRLAEVGGAREAAEQNTHATEQHYQQLLRDARVGIFQADPAGKCTYINPELERISGLYPKKALKEGIRSAIHPDDRERFDQEWQAFVEDDRPLAIRFRFKPSIRKPQTHVFCQASKVLNHRKEAEGYIGWVFDATPFHEERLREKALAERYAHFIGETTESFYQLSCETPISIQSPPERMAKAIMGGAVLASCSETFAAQYGATPADLKGQRIDALEGGCGPFGNLESVREFVESDYRLLDRETVRQDSNGKRLVLLNQAVGIVEDGKLVGIWGSQRNISRERHGQETLADQVRFMRHILDSLPADIHAKDTRCRYLYASKGLAEQTGISQEEWIGKTIFDLLPSTPREHDKRAIEVMKSGKPARREYPYEARGKEGWKETLMAPLFSDDGLVEGMVGISVDITERKAEEEEARQEILNKLQLRESEIEQRQKEFLAKLAERKKAEDNLKRDKERLRREQERRGEELAARLKELEAETDRRKKWEELVSIKEDKLRRVEKAAEARERQLKKEIKRREAMEEQLQDSQAELEKLRERLKAQEEEYTGEFSSLLEQDKGKLSREKAARKQAESLLTKVEGRLQKSQEQLKTLVAQHAAELEHEIAERNKARKELLRSSAELDELKQQFALRIEQETKHLKKELAQKQMREKTLRGERKKQEERIRELKEALRLKTRECDAQTKARKEAETLRGQIEAQLEKVMARQDRIAENEAQKLSLSIAEVRLGEVRLRKQIGDLQREKKRLENELHKALAAADAD